MTINYDGDDYGIADLVPPPPGITPDTMGPALTWIEQIFAVLQLAANADDPMALAQGQQNYADHRLLTQGALGEFPANEAQSQAELADITKLVEQIPQITSGIAGGIAGGVGGLLKPLTELPQQLAQSVQGFVQQGTDALSADTDALTSDLYDPAMLDEFGGLPADFGAEGSAPGSGGPGAGTAPVSMLGPAPTPGASTAPTSSRASTAPVTPATTHPTVPQAAGMGGYPMMPPAAMGAGTGADKDDKPATKRISVPSVKNGAPVQGRVSLPPSGPTVSKQVDGKTVATRRIVTPTEKAANRTE